MFEAAMKKIMPYVSVAAIILIGKIGRAHV